MNILKKIFPLSFEKKKDLAALIISILIYLLVGLVGGVLIGVLAGIPVFGLIFGILGGLIDLYVLVGIVLLILDYLKVLK